MATKRYYTLAVLENGTWMAQFGDYDKEAVKQEAEDSWEGYKTKVISSKAAQADIQKALDVLNS